MAREQDAVRELVDGDAPDRPGDDRMTELARIGRQTTPRGSVGDGGGLPENVEARRPSDFGPGGSAGASATDDMLNPGGTAPGERPAGDPADQLPGGDPSTESANLGKRPPGDEPESSMTRTPSREGITTVGPAT